MQEFRGKVAVVTGAASGIGWALAERSAQEGMKVVLADIEEPALARAAAALAAAGATVLAVPTDVSKLPDVENLARRTLQAFGAVHLLFNNAGVGAGSSPWESTDADWQWVLGTNLWGVIHGLRVFVPIMLSQGAEGHIVNTASIAGLLPYHPCAAYQTTKFAVVGLSENLYHSLAQRGAQVKASVLCPGWVRTQIMTSERNRPAELRNPPAAPPPPEALAAIQYMLRALEAGLQPQAVAACVFDAIREERFYIIVGDAAYRPVLQQRMEDVLLARNPTVARLA
jgi:NAD(P)-dependent dehydrogenase (short-subunit alcohol dehydrogenase family)